MKITAKGQYVYVWGGWHLAWLFGVFWWRRLGLDWIASIDLYFALLYTAFLFFELLGWRDNDRARRADEAAERPHVEVARTLSQWRQMIAQMGKPGSPKVLGWKGLAALLGGLDALLVYQITLPIGSTFAAIAATGTWLWLAPHFGWREIVG